MKHGKSFFIVKGELKEGTVSVEAYKHENDAEEAISGSTHVFVCNSSPPCI